MTPTITTALLAEATDGWGPLIVQIVANAGFAGLVAWYLLTRAGPKQEESHTKQLLEQRADLLALCQKERDLMERVVTLLTSALGVTVKENQVSIGDVQRKLDDVKSATREIIDHLRKDDSIRDELQRTQEQLRIWNIKHSSDPTGKAKRGGNGNNTPGS